MINMPTENSKEKKGGSVSDHLANERTFLAWVRTCIGIMAFGFVVVKFTLFVKQLSMILQRPFTAAGHGYSSVIGIFLVGFGSLLSLVAFVRYRITAKQIDDASFVPPIFLMTVLTVIIVIIGAFLVIYLVHNVES